MWATMLTKSPWDNKSYSCSLCRAKSISKHLTCHVLDNHIPTMSYAFNTKLAIHTVPLHAYTWWLLSPGWPSVLFAGLGLEPRVLEVQRCVLVGDFAALFHEFCVLSLHFIRIVLGLSHAPE